MSTSHLLTNVHEGLEILKPLKNTCLVSGNYDYYHYLCDGFDDRGWGCGYRTLQTLCSWINHNSQGLVEVPSIPRVQEILVEIGDKPTSFLRSRQWIGSFEVSFARTSSLLPKANHAVCLVIDKLYDIPCKIVHVNKGDELKGIVDMLVAHFKTFGSPVMMGGDIDCSSKGIMGIQTSQDNASLLIVDPHYVGKEQSNQFLQNKGWIKWQPLKEFLSSSFYNLCLPQVKSIHLA